MRIQELPLLLLLLLATPACAGWMKKSKPRPSPKAQVPPKIVEAGSVKLGDKTVVKRINSTHAYVSEIDEEMRDILHRIRKKATGMETLSQEAALMQVERIRKRTGNTFFDPFVKAEAIEGANAAQAIQQQKKSSHKSKPEMNS
eukprot:1345484-Amorphochlora_amoeboformis.AAC.3